MIVKQKCVNYNCNANVNMYILHIITALQGGSLKWSQFKKKQRNTMELNPYNIQNLWYFSDHTD